MTKRYGRIEALSDLSLALQAGVTALLGRNGAGKTTLLSLLLGLRRPTAGAVTLLGRDPRSVEARRLVGATPQDTSLPDALRVAEVCDLVRAHFRDPVPAAELLARFDLAGVARRQCGSLSGGERRRLAVALAFAGRPVAVFLDEPSTGLDVESRRTLWDGVRESVATGGAVVLTTHYLEEAEALAGRAALLDGGRLVADETVDALRSATRSRRIRVRSTDLPHGLAGVSRIDAGERMTTLFTNDVERTLDALRNARVDLEGVEVLSPTLEDAFVGLTSGRGA